MEFVPLLLLLSRAVKLCWCALDLVSHAEMRGVDHDRAPAEGGSTAKQEHFNVEQIVALMNPSRTEGEPVYVVDAIMGLLRTPH